MNRLSLILFGALCLPFLGCQKEPDPLADDAVRSPNARPVDAEGKKRGWAASIGVAAIERIEKLTPEEQVKELEKLSTEKPSAYLKHVLEHFSKSSNAPVAEVAKTNLAKMPESFNEDGQPAG